MTGVGDGVRRQSDISTSATRTATTAAVPATTTEPHLEVSDRHVETRPIIITPAA